MDHTGLTIGGFTQPGVARGLIENPANIEKGLCQRFLWLLPKPSPTLFEELQCVDEDFSTAIGRCGVSYSWCKKREVGSGLHLFSVHVLV